MSIPPLVCSTPPPPDQCDDEKDNEDFDIPYNLSQDEDEDSTEYDYGNYSSYNKYQNNTVRNKIDVPTITKTNHEIVHEPIKTEEYSPTSKNALNNNTKDNDEIIEDLDLKFDQVSINSGKLSQTDEEEVSKAESSDSLKDELGEINNTFPGVSEDNNDNNILKDDVPDSTQLYYVEPLDFVDQSDKTVIDVSTNEDKAFNFEIHTESSSTINELQKDGDLLEHDGNLLSKEVVEKKTDETLEDDDFGDFDDVKFVSSGSQEQQVTAIVNSENPWGSVENKDDFGNFKASFDEPAIFEANIENSTAIKAEGTADDDNDFGDFDDFQSSSAAQNRHSETETEEHESMFHLQSLEDQQQVVESVLSSIFEHDISHTIEVFEGKLESLLCETWGHLMDIDVRQPYIVNWNNSLGQKTLLKALCIDSRNILFGPKWAHMPKYAANLGAAPLQPQKQFASTSFPTESANPEKAATKAPGDTWVDPFTSDGKEFTYAEALLLDLEHLMATLDQMAHNHSALKISDLLHACNSDSSSSAPPPRPADLPVFEQATSKKSEKIYSSTLNIQPLRQINLPDTHIFTPTDSEIPRSKTIHYDSGSSVLTPQPVVKDPEDEYSDFQDFKASTGIPKPSPATKVANTSEQSVSSKETSASSSIPFQTSMLEPIKLETIMPTLNWPDPGHVKETFEDFSEFVSSTQYQVQEKQDASSTLPNNSENYTSPVIPNINDRVTTEDAQVVAEENSIKATYDDDFDTFQSAKSPAPIISAPKDIQGLSFPSHNDAWKNIDSLPTSILKKSPDFDANFSAFGDMPNNISHTNTTLTQIETPPIGQSNIPNNFTPKIETSQLPQMTQLQKPPTVSPQSGTQIKPQVLQPTRFSSSVQSKPTSGQILQPLSLEGYSQINWPNPGDTMDLSDLSRFNPVETLPSLKRDLNVGNSKTASPAHSHKSKVSDDDWGDFVSSEPKQSAPPPQAFVDNDEWTDFFSCSSTQPHNGLNTISLNVHTNLNTQKTANQTKYNMKTNQIPLEIPKLNYVTPKTNHHRAYSDRHFQNL